MTYKSLYAFSGRRDFFIFCRSGLFRHPIFVLCHKHSVLQIKLIIVDLHIFIFNLEVRVWINRAQDIQNVLQ